VTGRAAAACALYAGFLASWALAAAARRRDPSPYLLLGAALLEATLVLGALVGATQLDRAGAPTVHGAYLLASVLLLPLGLLLARDPEGRLEPAPLAVGLLALAAVVLRVDATA
jgi:F0F1-type ATP synthase membrane subunit c/vacuolar-type H+-ATPase subunit K